MFAVLNEAKQKGSFSMRFINRSVFAALVAVLAMSVIGSASASAAECPGTGTGVVLCSGGHVQEGTFAFTGTESNFEIEFSGWGKPTCSTAKATGQLVATKGGVEIKSYVIEWSGCSLAGHPSCKVGPIVFKGNGTGLKGLFATTSKVTLSPMEGRQLTEVSIVGCEQEALFKVTGEQVCSLPNSTVEAATHQISCAVGGSKLKWGTKEAVLALTETFKLSSGKAFSFQQS
ncbi:MAG TPA: hypothetical protein VGG98_06335 [Solirubrobacteraceae bacterium]